MPGNLLFGPKSISMHQQNEWERWKTILEDLGKMADRPNGFADLVGGAFNDPTARIEFRSQPFE